MYLPLSYYSLTLYFWLLLLTGCEEHKQTALPFAPGIHIYSEKPADTILEQIVPIKAPAGMVYVPEGFTQIGADDGQDWEKPLVWVHIQPFLMDEHPVTVGEFRQFINVTGYQTQVERFGDGAVLNEANKTWELIKGANWHHPQGPLKEAAPADHPVTQVSWNDAQAYAKWVGKRLPYEFEWEHAARNAVNSRTRYSFGNSLRNTTGAYLANTWHGTFPVRDAVLDGYHYSSPVGHFGKTPLGLTDMTGNVWQWCQDWRQSYTDVLTDKLPQYPTEKVQRGGSFLCEPGWCHGYRVSGRSFTSPETSLMHVGFRCVKDSN